MPKKSAKQKKNSKKEPVTVEKPSKPNRHAVEEDVEYAEESEGEAVKAPKKHKGIVALKHSRLQKKALEKNVGKNRKSLYQTMIDEGYSESYARSGNVKKSKSWQALTEDRLHEDKITNIHAKLMVAKKIDYMLFTAEIEDPDIYELIESVECTVKKIVHGVQGTHVWFWSPDNLARDKALDKAYKVLGKYAPDKIELEATGLASLSDAELAARIKQAKDRFRKQD